MLYTYKFYFKTSIVIYGIFSVMIGVTIIIQNNYKAYEDPVILVHIIFLMVFVGLSKAIIEYVHGKVNGLGMKTKRKQEINLESLDEFLNPVKENLEQIMEQDLIRKNFISLNKDWILRNLSKIISKEDFAGAD
jgi:hypothetical protein